MAKSATGMDFRSDTRSFRSTWGWFVALGVGLLIFGTIALSNLVLATLASVLMVSAMMIVGGIFQIITAIRLRKEEGFILWLASGLIYTVAGILTFYNPSLAAQALTLLLAFALIVSGFMRIAAGARARPLDGWRWIVASGVISIAVGAMVVFGWPFNSPFMLGIVLAVDLIFQGTMVIAFGMFLRSAHRRL